MSATGQKTGGSWGEGCHVARREWEGDHPVFTGEFSFLLQVTVGVLRNSKDDLALYALCIVLQSVCK